MWRLIAACALYMILIEALGVVGIYDHVSPLSATALVGAVALAFGIDVLSLWLALRFPVKSAMQRRLQKDSTLAT